MVRKFLKRSRQIGVGDSVVMRFDIPKRAKMRYIIIELQHCLWANNYHLKWGLYNNNMEGVALESVYPQDSRVLMSDGVSVLLTTEGAVVIRSRWISPLYGMELHSLKKRKLGLWGGVYCLHGTGKRVAMTLVYDI